MRGPPVPGAWRPATKLPLIWVAAPRRGALEFATATNPAAAGRTSRCVFPCGPGAVMAVVLTAPAEGCR